MKTLAPALLALAFLAPAALAGGAVTVTLAVGEVYHALPASKTCDVTVPAGSRGAAVLDAAVATGCISSWSAVDYGQPGEPNRFVTEIDGRAGDATSSWVFSHTQDVAGLGVTGATLTTAYGIDDPLAEARDGATYDFRYAPLVSFFLP